MLQDLKILSQERRRERYMVIVLWKISQGMVGGYNVTISSNERRGRTILPNQVVASAPAAVRRARECSLGVKGARLFNILPAHIRSMDSANVDNFKCELDVFLSMIFDSLVVLIVFDLVDSNAGKQATVTLYCWNFSCKE